MNMTKRAVTYSSCCWLFAITFYMQFLLSRIVKRIWTVFFLTSPSNIVYVVVTQIFAVGLPCLWFILQKRVNVKAFFSSGKSDLMNNIFCVLIGIAMQPVAMIANIPLQKIMYSINGTYTTVVSAPPDSFSKTLVLMIVICVMPAFFEELLVRGIMLTALKRMGIFSAMLISSVAFTLLHNDVSSAIGQFVLGIVLAFVVLMTGSVYSGMIAHFFFNATGLFADWLFNKHPSFNDGAFLVSLALACLFALLYFLYRIYDPKRAERISDIAVPFSLDLVINIPIISVVIGYIIYNFI